MWLCPEKREREAISFKLPRPPFTGPITASVHSPLSVPVSLLFKLHCERGCKRNWNFFVRSKTESDNFLLGFKRICSVLHFWYKYKKKLIKPVLTSILVVWQYQIFAVLKSRSIIQWDLTSLQILSLSHTAEVHSLVGQKNTGPLKDGDHSCPIVEPNPRFYSLNSNQYPKPTYSKAK